MGRPWAWERPGGLVGSAGTPLHKVRKPNLGNSGRFPPIRVLRCVVIVFPSKPQVKLLAGDQLGQPRIVTKS